VYANGDAGAGEFGGRLQFDIYMIPYDGDDEWVLPAFRSAVELAESGAAPAPGEECGFCSYLEAASSAAR
jgi:hypothetical protein